MKIGILTFHRAVNYGAVLQAYALSQKIRALGHDVEIIDYECKKIKADYLPCPNIKGKSKKYIIQQVVSAPSLLARRRKFYKFVKQNLPLSVKGNNISQLTKKYDIVIVGSDQVWQDNLIGGDCAFFLKGVTSSYKMSYAASFNSETCNIGDAQIKLLQDFNKISVREKENVGFLESKLHGHIDVVCDPTFLLSREQWDILLSSEERKVNKNYILAFNVLRTNEMLRFAETLAKKTGKKLLIVTTSVKKKAKGKYIRTASPIKFLSLVRDADCVVTNSFHGTAFSLIFNKKCFVEICANGNILNTRVLNLFEQLEVSQRDVADFENIKAVDEACDKFNRNLRKYAFKGEQYLIDSFNEAEQWIKNGV